MLPSLICKFSLTVKPRISAALSDSSFRDLEFPLVPCSPPVKSIIPKVLPLLINFAIVPPIESSASSGCAAKARKSIFNSTSYYYLNTQIIKF